MIRFPLLFNTFVAALFTASFAHGETLAEHGDWQAIKETENGNPVCVMSALPQKEEGDYTRRGTVMAIISHRPAEDRIGEVSFQAGYTFNDGDEATATIDGKTTFKLFTQGGHAWTYDKESDRELATAMKRGITLVVKGTSSRGTKTTDTYSLSGFTAAMNAIDKACGVK